jgi:CheY-like chemotaxis protein
MTIPILRKILVVEDEPDIQAVVRLSLEAVGGFEVKICDTGVDALQCAEEFLPDLMLLDVMMPQMNGLETMQGLRANARIAHIPVVFLTARVQPEEIDAYRAMGALAVICKPFDPLRLPDDIAAAWAHFQQEGNPNRTPSVGSFSVPFLLTLW